MKHGKHFIEKAKLVEAGKVYGLGDAVGLVIQTARAKFPESVDVAITLGVDIKKGTESVRGTVSPPHGTGKKVRIGVVTRGDNIGKAEKAGAAVFGGEDLIEKIKEGFLDFDVLLATPDMMPQLAKLGKILGGKGLMPNPKSGTVVQNVEDAIQSFQKGRMEFRMDKGGVVHLKIGSVIFEPKMLEENLFAVLKAVAKARPASAKGDFIRAVTLSATMGPGVRVDIKEFARVTG
jgi:large subunit ribosomal protein L1